MLTLNHQVFYHLEYLCRYERTRADYIEKLPKGKHSCKGVGKTQPDPAAAVKTENGVEIPLGEGVTNLDEDSSLLYNEYPFSKAYLTSIFINVHTIFVFEISRVISLTNIFRYIVYDTAQVKFQYLFKMKFNYKMWN